MDRATTAALSFGPGASATQFRSHQITLSFGVGAPAAQRQRHQRGAAVWIWGVSDTAGVADQFDSFCMPGQGHRWQLGNES
eukprot:12105581-Alexandrium_andersonii.AAC.1